MTPLRILNDSKNKHVEVHTSEQDIYTGILTDFDVYVNVSLKDAKLQAFGSSEQKLLGDTIIQGNLVTFVRLI